MTALDLRKDGKKLHEIASELGCSTSYAHSLIVKSLKELADKTEQITAELRELEGIRLDGLWEPMYKKAKEGDVVAANTCLKIIERRSKLFGLNVEAGPVIENTFNAENNETEVVIYIPENNRD